MDLSSQVTQVEEEGGMGGRGTAFLCPLHPDGRAPGLRARVLRMLHSLTDVY